jgi:hypothetical protein
MKQFIEEWKTWGPRVAICNGLLLSVMNLIGAKSWHVSYKKRK